jgi:2'-hydroxyisoflavone reductase
MSFSSMSSDAIAPGTSRRTLVLGGTAFVGRAVVQEALRRGHRVTMFNRGVTNPALFPGVERLHGDRYSDVSALADRDWDAVIDIAAYHPEAVERSVGMLRDHVDRYVFVSTLSVYASHDTTDAQREDGAVLQPDQAVDEGTQYGARKAACESLLADALGDRATVARAGLIVGPHDRTNRFVYWPRRMAAGGRVLAPGRPDDPLQFIDVRDLAQWLVGAASTERPGTFNVTGEPVPFAGLLDACRVPGVDAEMVWCSTERLLGAGLDPWMGVPLWIGAGGWEAANRTDVSRAVAAGLSTRPLVDTISAAVAHAADDGQPTLSPERERNLLARLGSR